MYIGKIGVTQASTVASNIERWANKNGKDTLTSAKRGRYIIRTDNNDGTYVKTCLELSERTGTVRRAFSTLMRNPEKFKQRLASLLGN